LSGRPPITPRPEPPKVVVIAADPIVRAALERMLADEGIPGAALADAQLAVADLGAGVRLPSLAIPTLALVGDTARPAELLAAGAVAVLRRDCGAERLYAALVAVHGGLIVVDAPLAKNALPEIEDEDSEELSARERQVLTLIASGLSNRKIAERLHISEHTAKFHLSSILAKLGVSTRTEAVVVAARRGLLWL
jgi:two-component system nitrate/nitrite response regulator NarL